jgi:hypothetical protein
MLGWYMHIARRAIDALDADANSVRLFGSHGHSAAAIKAIARENPIFIARNFDRPTLLTVLNSRLVRPTTLRLVDSSPIFAGARGGVL